ncbi:helix-turn-helix domain-containing protein [Plesiomonas shigelloides]|uniref:helix-turn-helix domain-containing protein n=1 Tax=Plesiomonas shigelloides TaxID=703 RepID=UPI001261BF27|nr:helix-turn-helix transcriptional regulator [Plesiomonas shigelloides]KAB7660484.1 helix-turn-helix domain-containing protein [Plesiomonas shigelloides]
MALTEFGKAVRKARIDIGTTLLSMAQELGVTSAFLSGLETGTKKISLEWIKKIDQYFRDKNHQIENLEELAHVANKVVPLDGLSTQQQMLVAGFAKSEFTTEQLRQFAELLQQVNKLDEVK